MLEINKWLNERQTETKTKPNRRMKSLNVTDLEVSGKLQVISFFYLFGINAKCCM